MKIIPAIDIIGGECVRLSEGDYATKKVYYKNPVDAALAFEAAGIKYIHLVDLDGAKARSVQNWKILEDICKSTDLKVDFSGGIKTRDQVLQAFELGAYQIAVGSLAVKEPKEVKSWLNEFGPDKIIIGADVKSEKIAIHGWLETSDLSIFEFIEDYQSFGATNFLCTDVSKDGLLAGPAINLYERILKVYPNLNIIASGGVASMADIHALKQINCPSVIVGKAIYEDRIKIEELVEEVHE